MAVNPQYAHLAQKQRSSDDMKAIPIFNWDSVGDEIQGKITHVGEIYKVPNKFFREEKRDSGTGEVIVKAQGEREVTKQCFVIETSDGERRVFMQKRGQWEALYNALEKAELSDPPVGWMFRGKRMEDDDKAHVFRFAFKA